jgi:hypothetical protein
VNCKQTEKQTNNKLKSNKANNKQAGFAKRNSIATAA